MSYTETVLYRGWNITVRYLKHSNSDPQAARSYTARAFAFLNDASDERFWTDVHPQTLTIINSVFLSNKVCAQTLLAQIMVLIDALRKPPCPAVTDVAKCSRC
jgi:hypothetical protein